MYYLITKMMDDNILILRIAKRIKLGINSILKIDKLIILNRIQRSTKEDRHQFKLFSTFSDDLGDLLLANAKIKVLQPHRSI